MNDIQALHEFWSGFGWKAYDENTVPEDAELPRITYSVFTANFDEPVAMSASLWTRSKSWEAITEKAKQINDEIGYGGVIIPFEDGAIWIERGVPFSQRMSDTDDTIRRIYLNIQAEYFTAK